MARRLALPEAEMGIIGEGQDLGELFGDGVLVQGNRDREGHVNLDVRLFSKARRPGITFFVMGDVDEGIDWLVKNRKQLQKAVRAVGG